MALKTRNGRRWKARRRRGGVHYYLGTFDTREEAEEVEAWFDSVKPPQTGLWARDLMGFSREKA